MQEELLDAQRRSGGVADGHENLANMMAILRLRPGDSRCRKSPVSVASLRYAASHLGSSAFCDRTEFSQRRTIHSGKRRLERGCVADHTAQIVRRRPGYVGQQRADHAAGQGLSARECLTSATQLREDARSQRGSLHWARARRRKRSAARM